MKHRRTKPFGPPFLALALALAAASVAPASGGERDDQGETRATYIVRFAEPPLAIQRGRERLNTHPARPAGGRVMRAKAPKLDLADAVSLDYLDRLREGRNVRLSEAQAALGRSLRPLATFEVVHNGMVLTLTEEEALRLARLSGVASVQREQVLHTLTDIGPQTISADQIWSAAAGVSTRGEGVVAGIIDGGINPGHPSFAAVAPDGYVHINPRDGFLGLCSGAVPTVTCNGKVIGIYDYIDGGGDGSDAGGHGIHVASTVAGNRIAAEVRAGPLSGMAFAVSGVAPRAHVISYKVCHSDGGCPGSALIAAMEQAAIDQVDVVNFSIGGSANDPWTNDIAMSALALREAGVLLVAAAGNSGPGEGTVGQPANAPWVLTVGAATHSRAELAPLRLQGAGTPPDGGTLYGGNAGDGTAIDLPLVVADPIDCAQGWDSDWGGDNMPASWGAHTFAGKAVVCASGSYFGNAGGFNAMRAGAAAVVLVSTRPGGGEVVGVQYPIPSLALNFADSVKLLEWLGQGSGHRVDIGTSTLGYVSARSGVLASFSSVGPTLPRSVVGLGKPEVVAPGVNILAAHQASDGIRTLSGTSMAAPHVTGAAALLRALHPDWGPDELVSALTTTASDTVRSVDGHTSATPFQQGSGLIDVARAARAALHFPISEADFELANPAVEGDPQTLNLPALVHASCEIRCSLARRVQDLAGGGEWVVEFEELGAGLTAAAQPQRFTLAAGQAVDIEFSFEIDASVGYNDWRHGRVRLRRLTGDGRPDAQVPISVGRFVAAEPVARLNLYTDTDDLYYRFTFPALEEMPDVRYEVLGLGRPSERTITLLPDSRKETPFDDLGDGVAYFMVPLDADGVLAEKVVHVNADNRGKPGYRVIFGVDSNGDGRPSADEAWRIPRQASFGVFRESFKVPAGPGNAWVLVHYKEAQTTDPDVPPDPTLPMVLRVGAQVLVPDTEEHSLVAIGPARVQAGKPFDVLVQYHAPEMGAGDTREGLVRIYSRPDQLYAEVPVSIHRYASFPTPVALSLGKEAWRRLDAGAGHDLIYVDIPEHAHSVEAVLSGAGARSVDLYVSQHAQPAGAVGVVPAPPRAEAIAHATGDAAEKRITLSSGQFRPGRLYVTPVNTGDSATETFSIRVDAVMLGGGPTLRAGKYHNPALGGHGMHLEFADDHWVLMWYAYEDTGEPTWLMAMAPALSPHRGVWEADLQRVTWNGTGTTSTVVGHVWLVPRGANEFDLSYRAFGAKQAQRMVRSGGGTKCATFEGAPLDASGLWSAPAKPGIRFGLEVQGPTPLNPQGLETLTAYLYDANGNPRWLSGSRDYDGAASDATFPMQQVEHGPRFNGWTFERTSRIVGQGSRRYGAGTVQRLGLTAEFAVPLSGIWVESLQVAMLSRSNDCRSVLRDGFE